LDQAFDVIAAHLNGRPVLEESKFEACKETSDTLVCQKVLFVNVTK
jgi:hypothetical protein